MYFAIHLLTIFTSILRFFEVSASSGLNVKESLAVLFDDAMELIELGSKAK